MVGGARRRNVWPGLVGQGDSWPRSYTGRFYLCGWPLLLSWQPAMRKGVNLLCWWIAVGASLALAIVTNNPGFWGWVSILGTVTIVKTYNFIENDI